MQWKQYVLSEINDKYHIIGVVASSWEEAIQHAREKLQKDFSPSQVREIAVGTLPVWYAPSFIEFHTRMMSEGVLPFNPSTNTNVFSVYYYPVTPDEYEKLEDPPSTTEVIAYITGDVEEKLNQWAKESGYTLESWKKPYPGIGYIELVLD
jgi:hypothetical protein